MSDQRCDGCRYYHAHEPDDPTDPDDRSGECRRGLRHLQVELPLREVANWTHWCWPPVRVDDWCGEWAAKGTEPDAGVLAWSVEGLPISGSINRTRIANALMSEQICTIGQLCRLTRDQLWLVRNVGSATVGLIDEALAKLGLHLRDDPPPVPPKRAAQSASTTAPPAADDGQQGAHLT